MVANAFVMCLPNAYCNNIRNNADTHNTINSPMHDKCSYYSDIVTIHMYAYSTRTDSRMLKFTIMEKTYIYIVNTEEI